MPFDFFNSDSFSGRASEFNVGYDPEFQAVKGSHGGSFQNVGAPILGFHYRGERGDHAGHLADLHREHPRGIPLARR